MSDILCARVLAARDELHNAVEPWQTQQSLELKTHFYCCF